MTPFLLKEFEIIRNSLDNIGDEYKIDGTNSPQYADAITAIDKLCKTLILNDFAKKKPVKGDS